MKKYFLLIIIIYSLLPTNAQNKAGISAGGNWSKMQFETKPDKSIVQKPGVHIGAVLNVGLTRFLSVQTELNFSQKGVILKYDFMSQQHEEKYTFNYAEIPLNLRINIPMVALYFTGGIYTSYMLSGNYNHIIAGTENPQPIKFGTKTGEFNQFDAGVQIGAGLHKKVRPVEFYVEAKYQHGLMDVTAGSEKDTNQNVFVVAGILFQFY